MPQPTSLVRLDIFWAKVDKSAGPEGCWPWMGYRNSSGYGEHRQGAGRRGLANYWRAHRVAYELLVGSIPDGLVLDHLCRVRHCVNPAHLEPVTNAENIRRGLTGHTGRTETDAGPVCRNGHVVVDANAGSRVDKRRGTSYVTCIQCARDRRRRLAARQS